MTRKGDGFSLSKSRFIKGLQCHKALYLHIHRPELAGVVTAERQAIFDSGSEVGEAAHGLFPGGVLVPYEGLSHGEQIAMTRQEIEKGTEVIYEAAFSYDDVFVKVDILRRGAGGWEIYEVKSSASMKDVYFPDAAVQYYVLGGSGLGVSRAFLVHINNEYVRRGAIEPLKLFTVNDVTADVEGRQDTVREEIARQRAMLAGSEPVIDIGPHCSNPYECDFMDHCWKHIPAEGSVFDIKGSSALPFKLYSQGIVRLRDVPFTFLSPRQRMQVDAALKKDVYVSRDALRDFLGTLWYPLYFLDFETFMTAIPIYDGTRPYQQIPYQYSLHWIDGEGGDLRHTEFLAAAGVDPREELIRKLSGDIPDEGCVLAYNAGFEIGVLQRLSEWFPSQMGKVGNIVANTRDLAEPFRRRDVYHWQFGGSYSLKAVLPALVPEMSYKELEVQNGSMAMDAYFRMCGTTDDEERERLRAAMLEYCRMDTLAMVRLLEVLKTA